MGLSNESNSLNKDTEPLLTQNNNNVQPQPQKPVQQIIPPQQQNVMPLYYNNPPPPTYQSPLLPQQQQQQQQQQYQYYSNPVGYQQVPQQQPQHVLLNPVPMNCTRRKIESEHFNCNSQVFSPTPCDPSILNFISPDEYYHAIQRYNSVVTRNNWIIFIPLVLFVLSLIIIITTYGSFFIIFPIFFILMILFIVSALLVYRQKKAAVILITQQLNAQYNQRQINFSIEFRTSFKRSRIGGRRKVFFKLYIDYPNSFQGVVVSQIPNTYSHQPVYPQTPTTTTIPQQQKQ